MPVEPYQYGEWKRVRVNIDYHVEFDKHWYSVPHQLVQARWKSAPQPRRWRSFIAATGWRRTRGRRSTTATRPSTSIARSRISGTWRGRRRGSSNGRPPSARRPPNWSIASSTATATPSRATAPVSALPGSATSTPTRASRPSARRALRLNACTYQSLKAILKNHLDGQAPEDPPEPRPPVDHPNLRGPGYYENEDPAIYRRRRELMLIQPTIDKLIAMRLRGMAEAFRQQQESADLQRLSFEERLGLLVDRQWDWRENRALDRRLRNGRLQGPACIEDIDLPHAARSGPAVVRSLTQESAWVREHQHLFLIGPTGIGKTWLARAFAQKACRDGYTALFQKAPELFRSLAVSRADGTHSKLLYQLGRVDLLVVDDFCMAPMTEAERRDFLEICDARYQARSTSADQPTPGRLLARADRRSDACRFDPRPARAQCAPHRAQG